VSHYHTVSITKNWCTHRNNNLKLEHIQTQECSKLYLSMTVRIDEATLVSALLLFVVRYKHNPSIVNI